MRVVSFDLEMSGLNADFGIVLCAVFATWVDGAPPKMKTIRRDRMSTFKKKPWDDRELVLEIKKELEKADIIVGWNSKRFDVPFLNARLAVHGEMPLERMKHIDLMYQARFKYKIHSASLESVLDFLNAPDEFRKTRISGSYWVKALQGDRQSMDYIVHHCVQDVKALDWVFTRMRHLVGVIHP